MYFIVSKSQRRSLLPICYGPFTSTEAAVELAQRLLSAGGYEVVGPAAHHSDITVADRSVKVS
jgi:hypothetical protein